MKTIIISLIILTCVGCDQTQPQTLDSSLDDGVHITFDAEHYEHLVWEDVSGFIAPSAEAGFPYIKINDFRYNFPYIDMGDRFELPEPDPILIKIDYSKLDLGPLKKWVKKYPHEKLNIAVGKRVRFNKAIAVAELLNKSNTIWSFATYEKDESAILVTLRDARLKPKQKAQPKN